ncbi:MAG: hypothetical protein GC162_01825 [Planctomycetes bacterium]|nr:hypothetical protein [Planctomycetota bacterium]
MCAKITLALAMLIGSTRAASAATIYMPGDVNNDRLSNIADLVILSSNFGLSGKTREQGDLDGDGSVSIADLVQLSANFGKSAQPLFASIVAPNGVLDFGYATLGTAPTVDLIVFNNSPNNYDNIPGLTNLTILSAAITGLDASKYSLINFTPGMTVARGLSFNLTIALDASAEGDFDNALLTLLTDQGAGLGLPGQSYSYTLHGGVGAVDDVPTTVVIPTPVASVSGIVLLLTAGMSRPRRCNY